MYSKVLLMLLWLDIYAAQWKIDMSNYNDNQKQTYKKRPVMKIKNPIIRISYKRKTGKTTKQSRRNSGWRGSR